MLMFICLKISTLFDGIWATEEDVSFTWLYVYIYFYIYAQMYMHIHKRFHSRNFKHLILMEPLFNII